MIVIILVAILTILFVLNYFTNHNEKARLFMKIPGPTPKFIVGNALEVIRSPEGLFTMNRELAASHNGIYRHWAHPLGVTSIYNPEDIEKIVTNAKHNEKGITYKFLEPWLRKGLLISHGPHWQARRKILTPAFHFNIQKQFCVIFEENAQQLAESINNSDGQSTSTVDLTSVLFEFTLKTICETAMGTKLDKEKAGEGLIYKKSIYELGRILIERSSRLYLYPSLTFKLSNLGREMKKHLDIVQKFTKRVICERKRDIELSGTNIMESIENDSFSFGEKKRVAMLDLLIFAEKEGMIDTLGIQEEVDTFMFAGHDTTASALVYFLMLLANHKNVQDKIYEELDEIFEGSSRAATMQDFSKMKYMECCIKESIRLYPPVPVISRTIREPIQLSNYDVPANSMVHIHIFDLHRREDLFKDALVFNPDRFLPENSVGRHPYAYIPFSAGPRNCIGQKFAMFEMKSVVTALLRKYELHPVTKPSAIRFVVDMVLRNDGPVFVKFVKRS